MTDQLERPIVMIAQAPGEGEDPGKPCTAPPFLRLARTVGGWRTREAQARFLQHFEKRNLLPDYLKPRRDGGEIWRPRTEARDAAHIIRRELAGRTILLVGRAVADAFGLGPHPLFQWKEDYPVPGARAAIIPDPIVGFWWAEEENRNRARGFFKELFEGEAPAG